MKRGEGEPYPQRYIPIGSKTPLVKQCSTDVSASTHTPTRLRQRQVFKVKLDLDLLQDRVFALLDDSDFGCVKVEELLSTLLRLFCFVLLCLGYDFSGSLSCCLLYTSRCV